jgi:hypothetical protein
MYLLVYLYHKDYKTFLMDRETYVEVRLGYLTGVIFGIILLLSYKLIWYDFSNSSGSNIFTSFYVLVSFLGIKKISAYSRANYTKIDLNLPDNRIRWYYYLMHILAIGIFFLIGLI